MMNPIQFEELLERVSGNREFVIQMLDLFFQSSDDRIAALRKEFDIRNYYQLAEQTHKLKGLMSNLSIISALGILSDLHKASGQKNDSLIQNLLSELETVIQEAKIFYYKELTS